MTESIENLESLGRIQDWRPVQRLATPDDIWHLKKLLEAAKAGDLAVFTSSLSAAECSHAEGIADAEVQRLFKGLLTSGQ